MLYFGMYDGDASMHVSASNVFDGGENPASKPQRRSVATGWYGYYEGNMQHNSQQSRRSEMTVPSLDSKERTAT